MSLSFEEEHRGRTVVLRLAGRLDTVTSKTLEDRLATAVAGGQRRLVLDLAEVDYVSSYGLRVFLLNAKRLKEPDDAFILCSVTPAVQKVLEMSGFDRILTLRGTLEEALRAPRGLDP